ncbi:MAG TPA: TonB family protein [Thermoanaerobaculia bacterium]
MSEPEEPDLFTPERSSMLASLGGRRRGLFGLFGRNGTSDPYDAADKAGADGPSLAHSMLGDLASHAPARVVVPLDLGPQEPFVAHTMLGDLASHAPRQAADAQTWRPSAGEPPFVAHTMLGDLASHATVPFEPFRVSVEPETHAMLAREADEAAPPPPPTSGTPRPPAAWWGSNRLPAAKPPRPPAAWWSSKRPPASKAPVDPPPPPVFGHTGLHSTVSELAGLEEHPGSPFPIERFILLSLVAHLVLVVLLILWPSKGPKGDFLAALTPQPKDDSPIPVIFKDALGPARENPKRSPLSDADRRAGGGDPSKPKAETPYAPPTGVTGLAPGPRGPRVRAVPQPAVPAPGAPSAQAQAQPRGAQGQTREAPQAAPQVAEQKPSEFPNMTKPMAASPMTTGPKETTRLAGLDSAIREAARGAVVGGGGQGGAPDGDADGGFVDSGPISFDTSWYDWGPYAAEMVRRIKLHWDVPELARLGWKGFLTVRFYILADGTVADAKILRGSGIPPFDFAAFQAIVKSSPFRPLPTDLHSTREGVTVTFFYNMRPETERAAGTPQ